MEDTHSQLNFEKDLPQARWVLFPEEGTTNVKQARTTYMHCNSLINYLANSLLEWMNEWMNLLLKILKLVQICKSFLMPQFEALDIWPKLGYFKACLFRYINDIDNIIYKIIRFRDLI